LLVKKCIQQAYYTGLQEDLSSIFPPNVVSRTLCEGEVDEESSMIDVEFAQIEVTDASLREA